MTLAEELLPKIMPYVGGIAGATLLYFIIMSWIAIARHNRDNRLEERQIRIERMTRDMWIDWIRKKQ